MPKRYVRGLKLEEYPPELRELYEALKKVEENWDTIREFILEHTARKEYAGKVYDNIMELHKIIQPTAFGKWVEVEKVPPRWQYYIEL